MMPFIGFVSVCFYDFDFVQCNVYIEAYKLLHRSVQKIQVLDIFHDDTAKQ